MCWQPCLCFPGHFARHIPAASLGWHRQTGVLKDGDKPRDFFWGDPWHYAMSRIVVAARANGLRPVDGALRGHDGMTLCFFLFGLALGISELAVSQLVQGLLCIDGVLGGR